MRTAIKLTATIRVKENHRPVFCHNCKGRDTFEQEPERDTRTESGQSFLLAWVCKVCGNIAHTSNPDYKSPAEQRVEP